MTPILELAITFLLWPDRPSVQTSWA